MILKVNLDDMTVEQINSLIDESKQQGKQLLLYISYSDLVWRICTINNYFWLKNRVLCVGDF